MSGSMFREQISLFPLARIISIAILSRNVLREAQGAGSLVHVVDWHLLEGGGTGPGIYLPA